MGRERLRQYSDNSQREQDRETAKSTGYICLPGLSIFFVLLIQNIVKN